MVPYSVLYFSDDYNDIDGGDGIFMVKGRNEEWINA